jgi:protease I
VAILVADGFEQLELTQPKKRLCKEGATVEIVSLHGGSIRGMHFLWRGKKVHVDQTIGKAEADAYDALVLPGGFVNPDLLRQSEAALDFVRAFDAAGKPIAVICHGPEVLISAGLVGGRTLACWRGIADDVSNAGGTYVDAPVVQDGNWVSSRGPQDLFAFNDAMVELFRSAVDPEAVRARRVRSPWRRRVGLAVGAASALALVGRAVVRRF